jgi:hypothetical protein
MKYAQFRTQAQAVFEAIRAGKIPDTSPSQQTASAVLQIIDAVAKQDGR